MRRTLDILLSASGLIVTAPLLAALYLAGLYDTGTPLFRQTRVGRHKRPFVLYKFRTMRLETPQVATHVVDAAAVTPLGRLLRRTKLDELPQLWNVLRGEMSLVGPRPCLFSQIDLIRERDKHCIYDYRPGITGLGQLKGVDMSEPVRLAALDSKMMQRLSLLSYLRYVILTVDGRGAGDRVRS